MIVFLRLASLSLETDSPAEEAKHHGAEKQKVQVILKSNWIVENHVQNFRIFVYFQIQS